MSWSDMYAHPSHFIFYFALKEIRRPGAALRQVQAPFSPCQSVPIQLPKRENSAAVDAAVDVAVAGTASAAAVTASAVLLRQIPSPSVQMCGSSIPPANSGCPSPGR